MNFNNGPNWQVRPTSQVVLDCQADQQQDDGLSDIYVGSVIKSQQPVQQVISENSQKQQSHNYKIQVQTSEEPSPKRQPMTPHQSLFKNNLQLEKQLSNAPMSLTREQQDLQNMYKIYTEKSNKSPVQRNIIKMAEKTTTDPKRSCTCQIQ